MSEKSKKILQEMFDRLFLHYGPQKWWPGETSFEVMVGAILTQNTNWRNVEKAIANLKAASALHPMAMFELSDSSLASLIKPAGYFNVKTKRLKNFVEFLQQHYQGAIEKMREKPTLELREALLRVKGIGPETADSILLYALEHPLFVIDAYTYRILTRHFLIHEEATYEEMQDFFADHVPAEVAHYNEFHALLVAVGKEFCRPKPQCELCPLKGLHWD